jgi:hypothetical protein
MIITVALELVGYLFSRSSQLTDCALKPFESGIIIPFNKPATIIVR